MKRDPLKASVLATKLIPNVSPGMAKQLNLTPEQRSLHCSLQTVMMLRILHWMRLPKKRMFRLYTQRASTVVLLMQTPSWQEKLLVFWQDRTRQRQEPAWKLL